MKTGENTKYNFFYGIFYGILAFISAINNIGHRLYEWYSHKNINIFDGPIIGGLFGFFIDGIIVNITKQRNFRLKLGKYMTFLLLVTSHSKICR